MKRLVIVLCIFGVLLAGCSKQPEEEPIATPMDYIDFKEEAPAMDLAEAESYLQKDSLDVTAPEYRQAVYTVNESKATDIIKEALEKETQTDAVKELFEGVNFRFIDGEGLASETVAHDLEKLGTFEWDEEAGCYVFNFYDRTLAQSAVRVQLDRSHALGQYREALELLLSDPNVEVDLLD